MKRARQLFDAVGPIPFALNDVKDYFTLFSKCFSSFVHTTCSLSVLVQYLAFAEVHLRVCTAISNCTTLGTETICSTQCAVRQEYGTIALHGRTFQSASSDCTGRIAGPCTTTPRLPIPSTADSSLGCGPYSLAVTQGITVVFLSSA